MPQGTSGRPGSPARPCPAAVHAAPPPAPQRHGQRNAVRAGRALRRLLVPWLAPVLGDLGWGGLRPWSEPVVRQGPVSVQVPRRASALVMLSGPPASPAPFHSSNTPRPAPRPRTPPPTTPPRPQHA